MDVLDTSTRSSTEALRIAREERRPILVEALTYRFRGHSAADPEEYRTKEEVEEWRERDPIVTFARPPDRGRGSSPSDEVAGGSTTRRDERVDEAVAFADASPEPPLDSLYDDVYVLGDQVPRLVLGRRALARARTAARTSAMPSDGLASSPSAARRTPERRASCARPSGDQPDARAGGRALMATMRYREALQRALREEMRRDERVFLMGEDIGVFNGAFKVTEGLLEEFGEKRVRDTPISENTIVGMGVGAAMAGLRPVVELMTINFSLLALDQIVNHAAAHPLHVRRPGRRCRWSSACRRAPATSSGRRTRTASRRSSCTCPGLLVAVPVARRPTPRAC